MRLDKRVARHSLPDCLLLLIQEKCDDALLARYQNLSPAIRQCQCRPRMFYSETVRREGAFCRDLPWFCVSTSVRPDREELRRAGASRLGSRANVLLAEAQSASVGLGFVRVQAGDQPGFIASLAASGVWAPIDLLLGSMTLITNGQRCAEGPSAGLDASLRRVSKSVAVVVRLTSRLLMSWLRWHGIRTGQPLLEPAEPRQLSRGSQVEACWTAAGPVCRRALQGRP